MCPTEFKCSVFADGELPEAEAREVAMHLEICAACSALVESLQSESRMLVQCFQDVDLAEEAVPSFQAAPEPIGLVRFAFGVIGAAVAFRLSTGILFGFELPPGLEWLDPREWVLNLGIAVNAAFYAVQNGGVAVSDAIQTAAVVSLGGLLLAGMARALKRSAAFGAVLSVMMAVGLFSSPGYAIDVRKGAAASLPAGEVVDDTLVVNAGGKEGLNKDLNVAGTVKGDLIAAGDVVTVSGTVEGNVLAFGRRVEITGTVGGTVIAAAQSVTISGKVQGSVIAGASLLTLSGEVARNFISGGANIELKKGALVGGNVAAAGGEVVIDNDIQKDVFVGGGMLSLRGSARNVTFGGGQVSLMPSARVGGDFTAHVQKESNVRVDPAATISGMKLIKLNPQAPSKYARASYYFWQIVRVITAFITGLIVFRLAPWLAPTRVSSGLDWLKAGGLGFIALVSIPIAAIIVACTVVGIPLALASVVLWLAGIYMAKIMVAEFVGRTLFKKSTAMSLLAGLALVILVVDLPVVGSVISFVLYLLGIGALVMTVYRMTSRPHLATA
jgi:cytoskeletal protein CcmA (bactofilin family)